jgi:hypothetical protein
MSAVNFRSPNYMVAYTQGICAQCGASTPLVALALPPGHEVHDVEGGEGVKGVEGGEGVWSVASGRAFLFFVECIPETVLHRMRAVAPAYRLSRPAEAAPPDAGAAPPDAGAAPADDAPHWANHCETCGRAFDDDELFGEPGGGFVPTSEAEARLIQLVRVDAALEAGAGGYAYEPQYVDCMPRG